MAIKKAFIALHTALEALAPNTTVKSILENTTIMGFMTASKGGFSGSDSFVTVGGKKVARVCAMLGAIFPHTNEDKEASYFYKNGSYMIGAEIIKATARKEWEATQASKLTELEDQMLDGEIDPKTWKEAKTEVEKAEFTFTIPADTKAELIETFGGIVVDGDDEDHTQAKALFTTAYEAGEVTNFSEFGDEIQALRDAGKPVETEDEA